MQAACRSMFGARYFASSVVHAACYVSVNIVFHIKIDLRTITCTEALDSVYLGM